jgi:dipeptidyl aminopeptidase/acylaminoacyl peptidase
VEKVGDGDELWLHPAATSTELPRLLMTSPVKLAAPTLNRDGTLLAFVDTRDDVKGDIWLFDFSANSPEPRRLTGPESADDAPVFSRDGTALVYQRQLPGSGMRELMRLHLKDSRIERLPIEIDAAFAAPSPDGGRWLFVSRKSDPNGDLWLWNEQSGSLTQLTSGAERDLYPSWESADTLLFTRQSAAGGNAVTGQEPGQIFRLHLNRAGDDGFPFATPLTSAALMAVAPIPAGNHFYFVAGLVFGWSVAKEEK